MYVCWEVVYVCECVCVLGYWCIGVRLCGEYYSLPFPHTHKHTQTHTNTHTYTHKHTHTNTNTHTHTNTHTDATESDAFTLILSHSVLMLAVGMSVLTYTVFASRYKRHK
jgi:hypothetical protein